MYRSCLYRGPKYNQVFYGIFLKPCNLLLLTARTVRVSCLAHSLPIFDRKSVTHCTGVVLASHTCSLVLGPSEPTMTVYSRKVACESESRYGVVERKSP